MFKVDIRSLEDKAYNLRKDLTNLVYQAKSGHLDTALSLVEVWLGLVYSDFFRYDPENGSWQDRDTVFLSEGHACPLQYLVNAELGYYPKEDVFAGNRRPNSPFQGHSRRKLSHGIENSNGSLGIGLWQAYGYALETDRYVFCIAGDGEFEEPSSVGLITAPHYFRPAANFTLMINCNHLAQDSAVDLGPIDEFAKAYNWQVITVDGHSFPALGHAYQDAIADKERPTIILCETVKGKGGKPEYEGKIGHHGVPPKDEAELKAYLDGVEKWRAAL